jgi:hypothetical protein
LYGNGDVLVPGHLPVGTGNLVEQDAADGDEAWTKDGFDKGTYGRGIGQVFDVGGDVKKVADGEDAATASEGACFGYALQGAEEMVYGSW